MVRHKPCHGGPREGAGRKPLSGKPMRRYQVMLDDKTAEFYRKQGSGNLSLGIRLTVDTVR